MSSHASAPPIEIALRRSRRVAGFLFVSHVLALGSAAYAHLPPVAAAAIAATVLTSFILNFRRHCALEGRRAVRRVVWSADGRWAVTDGTGAEHGMNERATLDTLVAAGVARSRAEALAWCVKLVVEHESDWISGLRDALAAVDEQRAKGPRPN